MANFHDHRPTHIVKKTFEVGQKWQDLDSTLVNIEKHFKQNMHGFMDLINHFEEFAENNKISTKDKVLIQLRKLDEIKQDFY